MGSFQPLSLAVEPPQPGVVVSPTIRLTLSMRLTKGEHIEIVLPGFLRMSEGPNAPRDLYYTRLTVITIEQGSSWAQQPLDQIPQDQYTARSVNASWDVANSKIIYTHNFDTVSGTSLRLLVPGQMVFDVALLVCLSSLALPDTCGLPTVGGRRRHDHSSLIL